jgi:hypothetical protein
MPVPVILCRTVLPIIVIGAVNGLSWIKRLSWRPIVEASALQGGLLTVAILVFAGKYGEPSSLPARLYALPFVLWGRDALPTRWDERLAPDDYRL